VLAVNVKPLRGRFANVDRSVRRWLFGRHLSLVCEAAGGQLSLTKEHEGDLPRRQDAVTPKAP
jgi:hypothetical protein